MSVRKRQWTTAAGQVRESWVVDYTDSHGKRRLKTWARKKEADAFAATARVQISEGTHVADSASATVREAGALWLAKSDAAGLERATVESYRQQLAYHIIPFIGSKRLSQLNGPSVRAFEDQLRDEGRSPSMSRRVMQTLGSILADAQERGLVARNSVRELRGKRRSGRSGDRRQKRKLKVGVDIPMPEEIRAILEHAKSRWRPLLMTAALTGLRASELRGLSWKDVELENRKIHVRQRADRYNKIGPPKSAAGERMIPLAATVVAELVAWRKICPPGALGLVFPSGAGNVETLSNITRRGFLPSQLAAGVTRPVLNKKGVVILDATGMPKVLPKYTGLHALRHFFASWCINSRDDNGLGLPPKVAQERLGHASIAMTLDVYGHLFPRGDDLAELDAAERLLLGGTVVQATQARHGAKKRSKNKEI